MVFYLNPFPVFNLKEYKFKAFNKSRVLLTSLVYLLYRPL